MSDTNNFAKWWVITAKCTFGLYTIYDFLKGLDTFMSIKNDIEPNQKTVDNKDTFSLSNINIKRLTFLFKCINTFIFFHQLKRTSINDLIFDMRMQLLLTSICGVK